MSEKKFKILIVDDNKGIHELIRMLIEDYFEERENLRNVHYEIDSVYQGQDAISKVQNISDIKQHYDLVFMDVRMPPGIDGIKATKFIWDHVSPMPVIICTAYSDYEWEEITNYLEHKNYLTLMVKPFNNIEFNQKLDELLSKNEK